MGTAGSVPLCLFSTSTYLGPLYLTSLGSHLFSHYNWVPTQCGRGCYSKEVWKSCDTFSARLSWLGTSRNQVGPKKNTWYLMEYPKNRIELSQCWWKRGYNVLCNVYTALICMYASLSVWCTQAIYQCVLLTKSKNTQGGFQKLLFWKLTQFFILLCDRLPALHACSLQLDSVLSKYINWVLLNCFATTTWFWVEPEPGFDTWCTPRVSLLAWILGDFGR